MSSLDEFLTQCVTEMRRRAELATSKRDIIMQGTDAFAAAVEASTPTSTSLTTCPVMQHLPTASAARQVPWQPTPRLGDDDDGSRVALGLIDRVRKLGDVTCGMILLAPGAAYPEHSHAPQEIYLPLMGNGSWRYGGSLDYRQLASDELVYNHPHDIHSVVAGADPLLALYVLWPESSV